MRVAIIGGGLAGCSLAYALKQSGVSPVVYEAGASLASGASGNPTGLYNPRFSALRTPESDYYAAAFSLGLRLFKNFEDIEWNPCGALHLMNDEKKEKRFHQMIKNWGWDPDHMRLVGMDEASALAGVDIRYDALYLPQSGSVSPRKLCAAYTRDVEVHLNTTVEDPRDIDVDAVVLACGPAIQSFCPDLPINTVRGQLTHVRASQGSRDLKCTLCYGGYLAPANDDVHILGSTFQRWLSHSDILPEDDHQNLQKLAENIPGLEEGMAVVGNRAAVRATAPGHFPVVGPVRGAEKLYVSGAHGSHGILSTLMAAHLLADMILERPLCLSLDTVNALSPSRFH